MPPDFAVLALALLSAASAALADDDPRDFHVALDRNGSVTVRDRAVDATQLDEALAAAAKALAPQDDSGRPTTDLRIRISCESQTPYSAFRLVFDAAAKARAWDFRITIGEEYVLFALPKDKGVSSSWVEPPQVLLTHVCATGAVEDHLKDWTAHAAKAPSGEAGDKAWIWIEGDEAKPAEASADPEVVGRVAKRMLAASGAEGKDFRTLQIAVDPDVAMKHVFALLAGLNGGAPYRTADEEKALEGGEGWTTSYPVPFGFFPPGGAGGK